MYSFAFYFIYNIFSFIYRGWWGNHRLIKWSSLTTTVKDEFIIYRWFIIVYFDFFVSWYMNHRWIFITEPFFMDEQLWYYLIYRSVVGFWQILLNKRIIFYSPRNHLGHFLNRMIWCYWEMNTVFIGRITSCYIIMLKEISTRSIQMAQGELSKRRVRLKCWTSSSKVSEFKFQSVRYIAVQTSNMRKVTKTIFSSSSGLNIITAVLLYGIFWGN